MIKRQKTHEPKIREATTRVNGKEYPRVDVDFGIIDGKRRRRSFKTRREAEQEVARWKEEQGILERVLGRGAKKFLAGDVQDAATAKSLLGPGTTLTDAAKAKAALDEAELESAKSG